MPSTWPKLADLPLTVEDVGLEDLRLQVSSGFERRTTTWALHGAGHTGLGEDVTYDAGLHEDLQAAGPPPALVGTHTLQSFSDLVGSLELFPVAPPQAAYVQYRRWGVESAALDLALRQAGTNLPEVLGRTARPITFVVSSALDREAPSVTVVERKLAVHPGLRFKLDATPLWDDALIAALQATGTVDAIDLKGQYKGTVVDTPTDPAFYRRIAEAFPDAWIEDPDLDDPEADAALEPFRDRITWDAPIHGLADVDALPFPPRTVNVKPSRVGALPELFGFYDALEERGIGAYGGGQFELGVGRGHIQLLAALFHPDGPNDVAPLGFDADDPDPGLPASPMAVEAEPLGFRRR